MSESPFCTFFLNLEIEKRPGGWGATHERFYFYYSGGGSNWREGRSGCKMLVGNGLGIFLESELEGGRLRAFSKGLGK